MADSSLDDFFAKKDKNKKTKKKDADGGAKSIVDVGKLDKPKKEKERPAVNNANRMGKIAADQQDETAEWKDVDEERDYTGLKVSALTLKDKEEELREQKALEVEQEKERDDKSGPWKGMGAGEDDEKPIVDESPVEVPTPDTQVVEVEPPKPAAPQKYVPPSLRNQPSGGGASAGPGGLQPVKVASFGRRGYVSGRAPELANAEEFPSLGDAPPPELSKDFQPVRHGTRDLASKSQQSAGTNVSNRYNALRPN